MRQVNQVKQVSADKNVTAYICVHIFKNEQIEVHLNQLDECQRYVSADGNMNADRNMNAYICVHFFKNEQVEVHRHILPLDCRYAKTDRNVSAKFGSTLVYLDSGDGAFRERDRGKKIKQ